jgi:hypothetical protein
MASTFHDLTWLDLGETDADPTVTNDAGTGIVEHLPDGGALLHTGPANYVRIPPNRVVKCVETVVQ